MANERVVDDDLEGTDDGPTLTEKEELFVQAFANPESETFGNATKSAAAAMYAEPHNAGWKLRRRPKIRAKLGEYHAAIVAAVGQVMTDLEHLRRLAVEKGDLQAAVRAVELQGKHLAAFVDRVDVDIPQVRQLADAERVELLRISRLRLLAGDVGAPLTAAERQEIAGGAPELLPAPAPELIQEGSDE